MPHCLSANVSQSIRSLKSVCSNQEGGGQSQNVLFFNQFWLVSSTIIKRSFSKFVLFVYDFNAKGKILNYKLTMSLFMQSFFRMASLIVTWEKKFELKTHNLILPISLLSIFQLILTSLSYSRNTSRKGKMSA